MILFRDHDFELARFSVPERGFPKHVHDEHVVSANLTGQETVWLDRRTFGIGVEGLTLYNPGQVQSCSVRCDVGPWLCVSLYIAPGAFQRLTGSSVEFGRPVACGSDLREELVDLGFAADGLEPLIGERLAVLAGRLARRHGGSAKPGPRLGRGDRRLARVAALLRDDLSRTPSLAVLATEAGVTPEHLARSFRDAMGLPPRAWQLHLRLVEARRRLRRGAPIVDVALDLGFSDQAHFHKLFRKVSGMTPGRYRRTASINR